MCKINKKEMGEGMYKIWTIIFLLVCGIIDIKYQIVKTKICVINFFSAGIIKIIAGELHLMDVFLIVAVGIVVLLIRMVTGGAIGLGDVYIIISLSTLAGISEVLAMLIWALVLCAAFAIVGIVSKKLTMETKIPFVPFMFLGYMANMILEKVNG